jgi:hypothetical protein
MQWQEFLLDSENPLYSLIPLILIFLVTWILSALSSKYKKDQPEQEEGEREDSGKSLMDLFLKAGNFEQQETGARERSREEYGPDGWDYESEGYGEYHQPYYMEDEVDIHGGLPEPEEQDYAYYGYNEVVTPDPIKPKWWGA